MAEGEKQEQPEQEVLFEFEEYGVEEQRLALVGASNLDIADQELKHGDEVTIEVTGIVQKTRFETRQKRRRDGGRQFTEVVRVVKVDDAKVVRATSRML